MKDWLKKFACVLGDLFTSKKFLAAAATVGSQVLMANPEARKGALVAGVAYVLGQGAADFGATAKKVDVTVKRDEKP